MGKTRPDCSKLRVCVCVCLQVLHLLQCQVCQGKDRVAWWFTEQKNTPHSPWALSLSSGDPVHRAAATGSCGFGLIPPWSRYTSPFHQRNWTSNRVVFCISQFKLYLLLWKNLALFLVSRRIFFLSYKRCASALRLFFLHFCQLEYLLRFLPVEWNLNLRNPLRLSRLLEQKGRKLLRMQVRLQLRRSWETEPDLPLPLLPGGQAQLELS